MKNLKCILISGLMVCSLCACGQDNSKPEENTQSSTQESSEVVSQASLVSHHTPEAIKERGELKVGIRPDNYEYFKNKDGESSGYEAVLAKEIAKQIGEEVKVEFVENEQVDTLLDSLEKGDVDMVLASLDIPSNPDLRSKFTLSGSYWPWPIGVASVYTLKDNEEKFKEFNSFSNCKIAFVKNSTQEELVKGYIPQATSVECKSINECIEKLESGEADIIAADESDIKEKLSEKQNIVNSNLTIPEAPEDQGLFIAMMKGCDELKEVTDKAITTNRENGNLETWIIQAWSESLKLEGESETGTTDDNPQG